MGFSTPPASNSGRAREAAWFLAFCAPNAALLLAFTHGPLVYNLLMSFTNRRLLGSGQEWVGLANYTALLQDGDFQRVVVNTVGYACAVVLMAQVVALSIALLLNLPLWGKGFFRTLVFSPWVTTPAAAAIVWIVLLDPDAGPLASLYYAVGIEGPRWLSSGLLALAALVTLGAWKETALAAIFYLAGLQRVPADLYEAARLETDRRLPVLWHVTLPQLRPVFFFLVVTGLIAAMKTFEAVDLMTKGGPVYPDSSLYVFHLYRTAFEHYRLGEAAAQATLFLVAGMGITTLQFAAARRWGILDKE